ncbi:hypothetical protein B5S31_g2048 [[Candida] boidinii]|nr:hypothetical protein B5S31_g2048 [[Candida] boidinii]
MSVFIEMTKEDNISKLNDDDNEKSLAATALSTKKSAQPFSEASSILNPSTYLGASKSNDFKHPSNKVSAQMITSQNNTSSSIDPINSTIKGNRNLVNSSVNENSNLYQKDNIATTSQIDNYNKDKNLTSLFNLKSNSTFNSDLDKVLDFQPLFTKRDFYLYPVWVHSNDCPIDINNIQSIFISLQNIFHFQKDNVKNMFHYLLSLLDSRASRWGTEKALISLYKDYIAGSNANYKKWYQACSIEKLDSLASNNDNHSESSKHSSSNKSKNRNDNLNNNSSNWKTFDELYNPNFQTPQDMTVKISIYLLCWGEANNIRFAPECLCFIVKCCIDHYESPNVKKEIILGKFRSKEKNAAGEGTGSEDNPFTFLENAITPLYNFIVDQSFIKINDGLYKKNKDHSKIIGYDDVNQLFWYKEGLLRINLISTPSVKLMDVHPSKRYHLLNDSNWNKAFRKTFHEYRTWIHVFVNFIRIWNIHLSMFWYYTCINCQGFLKYLIHPRYLTKNLHASFILSSLSLAGSIVAFLTVLALLLELSFNPRHWPGTQSSFTRILASLVLLILNTAPSVYIFGFVSPRRQTPLSLSLAIIQFIFSVCLILYFSCTPLSDICRFNKKRKLAVKYFTSNFAKLRGENKLTSYGLWICVFFSKFFESYFFLTLGSRDAMKSLSSMKLKHLAGDSLIGDFLGTKQVIILSITFYINNLLLFFLDTYLWYIIWNSAISVANSRFFNFNFGFYQNANYFKHVPNKILDLLLNTESTDTRAIVSNIWDSIILSMYRDHLISSDLLPLLIYQTSKAIVNEEEKTFRKDPRIFCASNDTLKELQSNTNLEAIRRISFFAQSLQYSLPQVNTVDKIPSFSVLIPHYAEKILLSMNDLLSHEDKDKNLILIDYLKSVYRYEWINFIEDCKLFDEEAESPTDNKGKSISVSQFHSLGFKVAKPENILRTRIWASLRSQTLYRTISGFMNYDTAIKILFDSEFRDDDNDEKSLEGKINEAHCLSKRKFNIVVSMQRLKDFDEDQIKDTEFLLRTYPNLQIAYIEKSYSIESNEIEYYSVLIDGYCDIDENGNRKPKYRIKLSGNCILGDGKSDNQNHSLIFTRGEFLQLIDANQDNYLEECLKIRNILSEFEDTESEFITDDDVYKGVMSMANLKQNVETTANEYYPSTNGDLRYPNAKIQYANYISDTRKGKNHISENRAGSLLKNLQNNPIAIVGTREYIFSENNGLLGDVAAGKEQTFGTLFARTLARVGGKLHYGHPDFLNSIFMSTRGGVSKSQKGLHLNEDIYAGMIALMRGGRIKHGEYFQCGKGRDMSFGSILNFTTKIGAGMGEQLLSREYYYLSTQLPIDRFLSFYFAHPGFHLNNIFIVLSIKVFLLFAINLAALSNSSVICEYDKNDPNKNNDIKIPNGCVDIMVVINWVQVFIISILVSFSISFIPLFAHEFLDRGFIKCISRIFSHLISLSPAFEIFMCRIYSYSLTRDLAVGGAKYLPMDRGFSSTRSSFVTLFVNYSFSAMYFGTFSALLLLYCSIYMWRLSLIYFWFTIISLMFSPFFFNPNQFTAYKFFADYTGFLRFLFNSHASKKDGQSINTWINYARYNRMQMIGYKKELIGNRKNQESLTASNKKSNLLNNLLIDKFLHLCSSFLILNAYIFSCSQHDIRNSTPSNIIERLLIVSFGPILVNVAILLLLSPVSLLIGPFIYKAFPNFISVVGSFAHLLGVLNTLVFFQFLFLCHNWEIGITILGMCCCIILQKLFFSIVFTLFVSKEYRRKDMNTVWWSGNWLGEGIGLHIISQPFREFICKLSEMSWFAYDFLWGHLMQLFLSLFLLIPYIDTWHSYFLLWIDIKKQLKPITYLKHVKRYKIRNTIINFTAFLLCNSLLIGLIITPYVCSEFFDIDFQSLLPDILFELFQPIEPVNNRRGLRNYRYSKKDT